METEGKLRSSEAYPDREILHVDGEVDGVEEWSWRPL